MSEVYISILVIIRFSAYVFLLVRTEFIGLWRGSWDFSRGFTYLGGERHSYNPTTTAADYNFFLFFFYIYYNM